MILYICIIFDFDLVQMYVHIAMQQFQKYICVAAVCKANNETFHKMAFQTPIHVWCSIT